MCHHRPCPCVTVEESVPAEECLLIYCKPVELYNIIQRRAQENPSFLPRCLNYKIKAKWKARLVDGNVIFNYRDQNYLLRKTEVARHFSCPFCLMQCGSFKGLRCHLLTSHDLFKFEFWVTEEYKAVNVSVNTDVLHSEGTADEIDLRLQSFCFCLNPRKRKRPENPLEKGRHIYPHVFESALPIVATESPLDSHEGEKEPGSCVEDKVLHNPRQTGENNCHYGNGDANGVLAAYNDMGVPVARAQSLEDVECSHNIPAMLQIGKSRKLSSERTDSRSLTLLQKRQFYHSHRAQPMTLEQVLSDRDSEDEVDDDITNLEDRRMLDDFVDVTKDEKHVMHLWNSFVRKQRVLADGHVPWACEAFLRLHAKKLVESPALIWCWRFVMIKLWNHGLLDACAMNNCSLILQKYQDEASANEKPSDTSCKPEP